MIQFVVSFATDDINRYLRGRKVSGRTQVGKDGLLRINIMNGYA